MQKTPRLLVTGAIPAELRKVLSAEYELVERAAIAAPTAPGFAVAVTTSMDGLDAAGMAAIPDLRLIACNGSGVIMQTWLGHQVAMKIAGGTNRASSFDGLGFPTRPLYGGHPWFLPMVGAWYRWRDRVDRWLD